ncbi:serine/threonine-protein kinase [Acidianus sp. RZ1]|uniref:serine/threonine-protein kinase n=1 Tax=Acidianus sp. RZ1 TaxID=1540082 RepID=UPI0014919355|nr:protein kinase [Acidianus sp. RZ1]NON61143.1 protein kinase [Acidianus sp. RZ1]
MSAIYRSLGVLVALFAIGMAFSAPFRPLFDFFFFLFMISLFVMITFSIIWNSWGGSRMFSDIFDHEISSLFKRPMASYLFKLGLRLYNNGDYYNASKVLLRSLKIDPFNADAYYILALCAERIGKLGYAEKDLRRAISLKPDIAEYHYELGNVLKIMGRLYEAQVEFREALRFSPNNPKYASALSSLNQGVSQHGSSNQPNTSPKTKSTDNIGEYRIVSLLGEGGSSKVYKVEREGKFYAIKIPKLLNKDFIKEVGIWLSLEHPNIVKLIDYSIDPPFLVMEYVEKSLDKIKKVDLITAIRISRDVISALKFAHSKGIVHGDVKPSNVLIDDMGRGKLTDWDSASYLSREMTNSRFTIEYASPEEISGGKIGPSSDIYQVCEVLYEVTTGRKPFNSVSDKLSSTFPLPSLIDPSLKPIDGVMLACLTNNAESRINEDDLESELKKIEEKVLFNNLTHTQEATLELIYYLVKEGKYNEALNWCRKRGEEDLCSLLERKVMYDFPDQGTILKKIEIMLKK